MIAVGQARGPLNSLARLVAASAEKGRFYLVFALRAASELVIVIFTDEKVLLLKLRSIHDVFDTDADNLFRVLILSEKIVLVLVAYSTLDSLEVQLIPVDLVALNGDAAGLQALFHRLFLPFQLQNALFSNFTPA